jgi:hypothetical protein
MWQSRGLTLKGKIIILKSLIIPKLLYVVNCMPVQERVITEMEFLMNKFIWSARKPKIKKNVLVQNIESGGLKSPDFTNIVISSKLKWVKRIICCSNCKLKNLANEFVQPLSIEEVIKNNPSKSLINSIENTFYKEIILYWNSTQVFQLEPSYILNQCLWHNKYITTKMSVKGKVNQSFIMKNLKKAGIDYVHNLFDKSGNVRSYDDIVKNYNVNTNIMQYFKLINAIPDEWKQTIRNTNVEEHIYELPIWYNNSSNITIQKLESKIIYNILIRKRYEKFTAASKWEDEFNIDPEDWKDIFTLPYSCSMETGLQTLAYKITHRIFPCKVWLCNLKVIPENICDYCDENDSIVHHLITCSYVNPLWKYIERWWNSNFYPSLIFTQKYILFGFYHDKKEYEVINYIILLAKHYIYISKINKREIFPYNFMVSLKNRLILLESMLKKNNNSEKWKKDWQPVFESL